MTNHTPSAKFAQLRAFIDVTSFFAYIGNYSLFSYSKSRKSHASKKKGSG
jgi:hypothetical protein